MISEISRFITGFIKIEISGEEKLRLMSSAVKTGIGFWDYNVKDERLFLSIKVRDFKRLIKLRGKYKVKIKIIKRKGLPFKIKPYVKRSGLIFGAIIGIILSFIISNRVWILTSSGSDIYSEETVLQKAEALGIYEGAKIKDIDPHKAMIDLMLELKGTDWVSVNTDGVKIEILIKDSLEKPDIYKKADDTPENIIAKKDGVIREIEAEDGMVSVKIGEGVKKGDILITGLWDTYDKWGVKTGKSFQAKARGKVFAEVKETFSFEIKLKDERYFEGESKEKKSLNFFGINIPLTFPLISEGDYTKEIINEPLYLLNEKMPVKITTEIYKEQFKIYTELTRKEGENILLNKYKLSKKDMEVKGHELLTEKTEFNLENGILKLTAECIYLENIAESSPILFKNN